MRNGPLRNYIKDQVQFVLPSWIGKKITNIKWATSKDGFVVTINNSQQFFTFEQLGLDFFKIAILQKQGQLCNSKDPAVAKQ